jgi:hypothetical protein
VLGSIPATSKVMVAAAWQGTQFPFVAGVLPVCFWNEMRMVLRAGHAGELKSATSGFAVFFTTGALPVTIGLTLK